MVKMQNIKRDDNIITFDFIPENSKEAGKAVYDIQKSEITEQIYPKGYENCKTHLTHCKVRLKEMLKNNESLEDDLMMWY